MSVRSKMHEPNLAEWSTGSLQSTRQQDSDSCGLFLLMVIHHDCRLNVPCDDCLAASGVASVSVK